jgi:homoserine acetyltransferase
MAVGGSPVEIGGNHRGDTMAMVTGAVARGADLGVVEDRYFEIRDFRLQNGTVMPQVGIAYETSGRLAADRRNAILITHRHSASGPVHAKWSPVLCEFLEPFMAGLD